MLIYLYIIVEYKGLLSVIAVSRRFKGCFVIIGACKENTYINYYYLLITLLINCELFEIGKNNDTFPSQFPEPKVTSVPFIQQTVKALNILNWLS